MIAYMIIIILIIVIANLLLTIWQFKIYRKKENIDEQSSSHTDLKYQIKFLSFALIIVSVVIGFLGWNAKESAVDELKKEIFKEFDSILSIYVVEDTISISPEETKKLRFKDMKRIDGENLPKFYKAPLVIISTKNGYITYTNLTKDFIEIRMYNEGEYNWGEIGPHPFSGKITLWIVEKE